MLHKMCKKVHTLSEHDLPRSFNTDLRQCARISTGVKSGILNSVCSKLRGLLSFIMEYPPQQELQDFASTDVDRTDPHQKSITSKM